LASILVVVVVLVVVVLGRGLLQLVSRGVWRFDCTGAQRQSWVQAWAFV